MKKIKKTGIAIMAVLMFFLSSLFLVAALFEDEKSNNHESYYGNSLIDRFVGNAQNEYEENVGVTGGDKYREWYTGTADNAPWCATFVSYIANKTGIIETVIPKFQSCDMGVSLFESNDSFFYTSNYGGDYDEPDKGDIIFFSDGHDINDSTHVGIVSGYDNGVVSTIEGNSGNQIKTKTYANDSMYIIGYGVPDYQSYAYTGFISDEFKYFAKFESGANYNQTYSVYDGYHALGYYQFDNRYALQDFLKYCYDFNGNTYKMFKPFLNISKDKLADNSALAKAWNEAYNLNQSNFCDLQDQFEYNNYYLVIEDKLIKKGFNIANRPDCIKGLICGISNLFGSGGAVELITSSGVDNSMSDENLAKNICNHIIENEVRYSTRYKNELEIVLNYLR